MSGHPIDTTERKSVILKKWILICLVCLPFLVFAQRDVMFQVSTLDALVGGVFDGETTLAELGLHGNFGIGTFNAIDGEMLLLDGRFYRIAGTGEVKSVDAQDKSPFAAVTFFDTDQRVRVDSSMAMERFYAFTDARLPTPNLFYAVKVSGTFKAVKTRSVPKQEKPYKTLADIVKTQPVFDFKNVEGVLVGFRCPAFVRGIQYPGYHLHFLAKDAKGGGHILNFITDRVTLEIDRTDQFLLKLPNDETFFKANLSGHEEADVKKVEE
jgi:acetolactate decarboxylase